MKEKIQAEVEKEVRKVESQALMRAKHAPVTFPLPPLPCQDCEEEKVVPRQFNETVVPVLAGLSLYLV